MVRRSPPKPPRASRHRARQVLFACFALGMVLAQLFAVGHLVFVSHAICEHGALQHADTGAAPRPAEISADAAEATGRAPRALPGRGAGEHEHCDPFARAPAAIHVDPSFAAPELIQPSLTAWHQGSPFAFETIGLLALAPKSSPPISPRLAS
jgi:hypothetical protein